MPSTAIRHATYAPETERLTVTFVTGRVYEYFDVPAALAEAFRAATSKGAFFNRHIRGSYSYREITGTEPVS